VAVELTRAALIENAQNDPNFSAEKFIDETVKSLQAEAVDEQFTRDDILISSNDQVANWRSYGNRVAVIIISNAMEGEVRSELEVLNDALRLDDPIILEELDPRIKSYEKMLAEMLSTPVPESLVREHLSLINVYQALLSDNKAFRNVLDDAIPSMMRFRRYFFDANALYTGLVNLYEKLDEAGIQWNEGDAASQLVSADENS